MIRYWRNFRLFIRIMRSHRLKKSPAMHILFFGGLSVPLIPVSLLLGFEADLWTVGFLYCSFLLAAVCVHYESAKNRMMMLRYRLRKAADLRRVYIENPGGL